MNKVIMARLRANRAMDLEGEGASEAGFTLIELMVVLLIIAILLAIAIPTFLSVTKSANDRAAQSNLTNALTEVSATYQNQGQVYDTTAADTTSAQHSAALVTAMGSSAPEFQWSVGALSATTTNTIQVDVSTDDAAVILAAYSAPTKTCWYAMSTNADTPFSAFAITQASSGLTSGTWYTYETGQTSCAASQVYLVGGWAQSYGTATNAS